MATTWYGSTPGDYVIDSTGKPRGGAPVPVYVDSGLTTAATGLVSETGVAVGGTPVSSTGGFLRFGVTDGSSNTLYCARGDGSFLELRPHTPLSGNTAAQWTTLNPVLPVRVEGIETDTLRRKVGDGVTPWNSLRYAVMVPGDGMLKPGTYTRRAVTPDSGGGGIIPMAKDPTYSGVNGTGRLWALGLTYGQIGFTDDDGATWTAKTTVASQVGTIQSMIITSAFLFVLTGGTTSLLGAIYRSPAPDSNGNGLSFTKVFDLNGLVNGPGGVAGSGSTNSTFRNSSLAIDPTGQYACVAEYGTTPPVTGGPAVYFSSNINAATAGTVTWTKVQSIASAKHAHAVKYINGQWWVSCGDMGNVNAGGQFTGIGMWVSNSPTAPTQFIQRSIYGADNGSSVDVIDFQSVTVNGLAFIVGEADAASGLGPIVYGGINPAKSYVLTPTCVIPPPYLGTMRQLTFDPATNNMYWVITTESGAIGQAESAWMAPYPYTNPILLESTPAGGALALTESSDPLLSNGFWWSNSNRMTLAKVWGQ